MMQRENRRIFLSPSLHHVRYREKSFPLENKSISPCRTSSYTSLNSFLKERHLSLDDYLQLRKALRTLLDFASNSSRNENERVQQRLTSPYLQSRSNNHDQSSLPLYTDEHFIRNGLLNHNEGPDVDEQCVSTFFGSSPLPLRSTKNHFLSAMTSNFTNDRTTNMSSFCDETDSIFVRRQKVQSWERENRFQRSKSPKKQVESQTEGKMISHMNGSLDQIFPMMKVLAPLIVIRNISTRDFTRRNSISKSPKFSSLEKTKDHHDSTLISAKRRRQMFDKKAKSYLLADFDSLLTKISPKKRKFS